MIHGSVYKMMFFFFFFNFVWPRPSEGVIRPSTGSENVDLEFIFVLVKYLFQFSAFCLTQFGAFIAFKKLKNVL